MGSVVNGDLIRVSARWTGEQGQDIMNVLHCEADLTTPMDDDDFLDYMQTRLGYIYSTLNPWVPTTCYARDVKCDVVEFPGGVETVTRNIGTIAWSFGFDPSGAGDGLPSGIAALVKLTTSGVRTLGKKFFGPLIENAWDGTLWDSVFLTNLLTFAAAFTTPGLLTTGEYVNWGTWGKRAGSWLPFLSAVCSFIPAYQRRRKSGVGS